ncbi:hotdog fold thioesterase [Nakamurella sp.]|uniref:hotdog fold thioesterase n=1 Tax=Nakamurella sp. TaxID=1869182 RepID=UPI00378399C3
MTVPPGPAGTRAIAALGEDPDPAHVLAILHEMRGELAEKMGIEITEFTRDRVVATMPVAGNRQPFGLLHGGASAALAETMGSFHGSLVGAGKAPLGIDLNCTHHRSATDGFVTAVSTPSHLGRTICTFEIVISDETERRICSARLTVLLRDLGA